MEKIIFFLPLLGGIISYLLGTLKKGWKEGSLWLSCGCVIIAAVCSWILFFRLMNHSLDLGVVPLLVWLDVDFLKSVWSIKVDALSVVMSVVVTTVSSVVHVYSLGYMKEDGSILRFMAYLGLFTFFMLALVFSDNILQLFFGWEGVGLASYLLIGFYYKKQSACAAAKKAFVVNRVADLFFMVGIFALYFYLHTLSFDEIFQQLLVLSSKNLMFLGCEISALNLIAFCLFIGAMGKSAQIGFHVWLPDAMEGPTPVSALIHAATMVTAGVFLICRFSFLFDMAPFILDLITVVGATTALLAAFIALTQNDIKKIVAYSTCSQLGYMFFAAGVSSYKGAMFHLMTHAFFKALLFLGAGSVIHALSHEQDIQKMGGLAKKIPWTCGFMWVGTLALVGFGFPELGGLSGFYSKDFIIESAYLSGTWIGYYAWWVGVLVALMTSFYSFRLLFLVFYGSSRCTHEVESKIHESPLVMLLPLAFLSIGSIFAGYLSFDMFVGEGAREFWSDSLAHTEMIEQHLPFVVSILPFCAVITGCFLAYALYLFKGDSWARYIKNKVLFLYDFSFNKCYFDELYELLLSHFIRFLSMVFARFEAVVLNFFLSDGLRNLSVFVSGSFSYLQSGALSFYVLVMFFATLLFFFFYLLKVFHFSF